MENEQLDFNAALKRLKEIVQELEDPTLSLEKGLELIEEGIALHKACKTKLEKAEIKITKLFEQDN